MHRAFLGRVVGLGLLVALAALVAIDARATYGARISVDEPQYLLTAISLGEDLDLDIADELDAEAYRDFHEATLLPQTLELNSTGQRLSPHDPLLPMLLAIPMKFGGWVAARLAMAAMVGIAAALTLYLAERRFAVSPLTAVLVVGGFFLSPPLISYGNQIYPAMPAAIAVLAGVAVVVGDARRWWWVGCLAIVALPWLSVKHVPVAVIVALGLGYQLWGHHKERFAAAAFLVVSGVVYVVAHRQIYGGWTVYATGDHFVDGEWEVVGTHIDIRGRTRRLIGLIVDRGFGLAAWAPAYLGAPLALTYCVKRRVRGWPLLLALIMAAWCVATWIALTMHGWWWPGRQVVPVLPLLAIMVAIAVDGRRRLLAAVVASSVISFGTWVWLAIEASTDRRTLIFDFQETANPLYRAWRMLLPDHQSYRLESPALTMLWTAVLIAGCVGVWYRTGRSTPVPDGNRTSGATALQPSSVREHAS